MPVNIIFLLAVAVVLALIFVFCLLNKPRKPLFTGTAIITLLVFLLATELINMGLSTPTLTSLPPWLINAMVGFLTGENSPKAATLEQAFSIYMYVDIALIILCLVSMIVEVHSILTFNSTKNEETSKKNEEIRE